MESDRLDTTAGQSLRDPPKSTVNFGVPRSTPLCFDLLFGASAPPGRVAYYSTAQEAEIR